MPGIGQAMHEESERAMELALDNILESSRHAIDRTATYFKASPSHSRRGCYQAISGS